MQANTTLKNAILVSLLTAGLLFTGSYVMGKYPFFLLLNGNGGNWLDKLFQGWTYLGDGWVWLIAVIIIGYYKRNKVLLAVFCVIISTLFAQGGKHLLYPNEMRPAADPKEFPAIHTVPGVELHTSQSFPSGHTATAFSLFFLISQLFPHRWTLPTGFILATGVGYSRIYLAQHFPVDVAAGIVVGVIATLLSIYFDSLILKKSSHR